MKGLLSLRYIYKISSKRISKSNWDMTLTREDAIKHNEYVSLASSSVIRMIDKLNGIENHESEVEKIKCEISDLKSKQMTNEVKKEMKLKVKELKNLTFMEDYLCVVMESRKDYDIACRGFTVNGIEYKRLLATSGGVKKSTIVFVSKRIHDKLYNWLNNDRNKEMKFVPAKLEAYISLACSASIPVSKPKGVLVVHDVETTFKDDVIIVNGLESYTPAVTEVNGYESKNNATDGFGLISPDLSIRWSNELHEDYIPSGMCIRNAFCKGMLFTFDFYKFAKDVAKSNVITDVWGDIHNVEDIEVVLTTSMLKLWDSYNSIDHYLSCCERNNHTFSVTKILPKELDNEQTMNYQFLQSLNLSDDDIYNLCKPTIDEIKDILSCDVNKALLYTRGLKMNAENINNGVYDYTTGLMVDEDLLKDKFVYNKIKDSIKNRINEAKMGVINVNGNFSIISGDPYILCEGMFGLKPNGLLKSGEFYSKYWIDKNVKCVTGMRAPMSVENNIITCNIISDDVCNEWYKYMNTVFIMNAWDNSCSALNGADFDGDSICTTDNMYISKGVSKTKPIICVQGNSSKKIPTEKDFIHANKQSFGSAIGTITNYATTLYAVLSNYDGESKERDELKYRLKCMQDIQQAEIDRAKGVLSRPTPKEWYDYKINKIMQDDDELEVKRKQLNLSILANKKPYFMIYNYDKLKSEYSEFRNMIEDNCFELFGVTYDELKNLKMKTPDQIQFINNYNIRTPVNESNCTMNKICWLFENEFPSNRDTFKFCEYDKEKMKSESIEYSKTMYNNIKKTKREYEVSLNEAIKEIKRNGNSVETLHRIQQMKKVHIDSFYDNAISICTSEELLCNIMVDISYASKKTKQLMWDICGKQIIKNMLKSNGNKMLYIESDKNGNISYKGNMFSRREVVVNE